MAYFSAYWEFVWWLQENFGFLWIGSTVLLSWGTAKLVNHWVKNLLFASILKSGLVVLNTILTFVGWAWIVTMA